MLNVDVCVGKDEYADRMLAARGKDGVECVCVIDETTPTGACVCRIADTERPSCTDLKAANYYTVDRLEEHSAVVEKAMVVYSAVFFVTVFLESIASSHCGEQGRTYCVNLSTPFIMQVLPLEAVLMKTVLCSTVRQ